MVDKLMEISGIKKYDVLLTGDNNVCTYDAEIKNKNEILH